MTTALMRTLTCAICGLEFHAARRPAPEVIDPWLTHHAAHDPTIRTRAQETWR